MGRRLLRTLCLVLALGASAIGGELAYADGVQFNPICASIAWNANTEPDLAGYRLYDRPTLTSTPTLIKTYGVQITSATSGSVSWLTYADR